MWALQKFAKKRKKVYRKKGKVEEREEEFKDGGGACSGTEEGDTDSASKRKVYVESLNVENDKYARQCQGKRSKKLFFGRNSNGTVIPTLHSPVDLL